MMKNLGQNQSDNHSILSIDYIITHTYSANEFWRLGVVLYNTVSQTSISFQCCRQRRLGLQLTGDRASEDSGLSGSTDMDLLRFSAVLGDLHKVAARFLLA